MAAAWTRCRPARPSTPGMRPTARSSGCSTSLVKKAGATMSEMVLSSESDMDWEKAHRAAFVQDILAAFTQRPADLLPFEEVRRHLRLLNMRYLGIKDVPLTNIVGSVGRY